MRSLLKLQRDAQDDPVQTAMVTGVTRPCCAQGDEIASRGELLGLTVLCVKTSGNATHMVLNIRLRIPVRYLDTIELWDGGDGIAMG